MKVGEPFRNRGLGSFLVQELKRHLLRGGQRSRRAVNPKNIASRRTLQKAGFVPCGHIVYGTVSP